MRHIAAILLITVIIAAPVSRYADYLHCMTLAALHLQANCGCDSKLYSVQSEDPDNPQQAVLSHVSQGFSDWFFYDTQDHALIQSRLYVEQFILPEIFCPAGFVSALIKPPSSSLSLKIIC